MTILVIVLGVLAILSMADGICFYIGRKYVDKNPFFAICPGSGFVALWRKIKYETIS